MYDTKLFGKLCRHTVRLINTEQSLNKLFKISTNRWCTVARIVIQYMVYIMKYCV